MPEIPDLDAIVAVLRPKVAGATIAEARLPLGWMLRSTAPEAPEHALAGQTIEGLDRRGKHVVLSLSRATLVIHPMLVGRFYYQPPDTPYPRDTALELVLSTGRALRYADEKKMGRLYLVPDRQFGSIPGFLDQGPDALDPDLTFERFLERFKGRYGEIKGLLTNAKVVAGIGNAYADEILFEAGVYPFRRKKALSEAELRRVFEAIRVVLERATAVVAERMGEQTQLKIRDFLNVHGKGGKPCPRCGQRIAQVGAWERATNFCRRCQPGLMTESQRQIPLSGRA